MNPAPSAVPDFFRNSWISIFYFRYPLKMRPSFVLCPLVWSTQLLCLPSVLRLLSCVQHFSPSSRICMCSVKALPFPTTQPGLLSSCGSVLCVAPLLCWCIYCMCPNSSPRGQCCQGQRPSTPRLQPPNWPVPHRFSSHPGKGETEGHSEVFAFWQNIEYISVLHSQGIDEDKLMR